MKDGGRLWMSSLLLGSAAAGCAHVEAPPGGPEDLTPPAVLTTRPAADTLVPGYDGAVRIVFDKRISEQGVQDAVLVSPRTSPVEVQHGRDEIRIRLRRGWEPGVIYHVIVQPEIRDLFNNRITEPFRLVFSTGPEIPDTRASGTISDRITGRPEAGARVEAIRMADSLVYATVADRDGHYELDRLPEGEYRIRAYVDTNQNRALDDFEPRDTSAAILAAGEPISLGLRLLMPDSTPPAIVAATAGEQRLELRFDDYLDPEQTLRPDQLEVRDAEDNRLSVARLAVRELSAPADPGDPADPAMAAPAPAAEPAPTGPLPSQTLVAELAEGVSLAPGAEYRLVVRGIRNVNGLTGDSEHTLETPAPAPVSGGRVSPAWARR